MNGYNPDILSCLSNLSNDEVYTPPSLANKMLDLLPNDLWSNSKAKFLDPVSKSGVFLREIAKRLMVGLEQEIPDKYQRANHIFTTQLYGIAITELTSLLSRRTVYCSKTANGKYSVCEEFKDNQGNIIFNRINHTWDRNHCMYCGASKEVYDRGDDLETYAYPFIHTYEPEKIFNNMTFDVIIGNPPYQLNDGGGTGDSAKPLYHLFVEQAKKLNPRYLVMIIPARWYSGGKGLDDFRNTMLNDKRISELHDFSETRDVFQGLNIRGGICYFLWDRNHKDICKIYNHIKGNINILERPLLEKHTSIFIRYNKAISIFRKVKYFEEETFDKIVSSRKPFGIDSNYTNFKKSQDSINYIKLYRFGEIGYISLNNVLNNVELISRYKVIVSKASPGGDEYPHSIVSKPIISEPNSVCTETYLVIKDVENITQALNLVSYIKTYFFRFMMLLTKNTQNISKSSYQFVPLQDFNEEWTDEKLYKKYKLDEKEIAFIESMIKPME
jgi:site-specific DNA-methyltransferase (adenine-specific)